MSRPLTLLMAQINPIVGGIAKNTAKIIEIIETFQQTHDLIIFPELALTGYPLEDLLFRPECSKQVDVALQAISAATEYCHVIVGHPYKEDGHCYNAASLFVKGECTRHYYKQILPHTGVFDEYRYFQPGKAEPFLFTINDNRFGLCICEDLWQPGPVDQLIQHKAEHIICINASPFDYNKYQRREALISNHAKQGVNIFYVNQVGGQDELVFDGQSLVIDKTGTLCARAPAFIEYLQTVTINKDKLTSDITPLLSEEASIYQALCCGLKDYVEKNHFPGVLLGLSGGIDSALTLAIAVDALSASQVQAILMPSRYTASMSIEDATIQTKLMQVQHQIISIEPLFETFQKTLAPSFKGLQADTTEENIQARIRGNLLMALSNKTGNMLLTTSNKSEIAVGYGTLYGDMAGGFGVLKDVLKTLVYRLARYRNTISEVIPMRVIERPPSAELATNQIDQDSLPDYATLDAIIEAIMLHHMSVDKIIEHGYPPEIVFKIIQMIQKSEFKRRQAPPGIKISQCAFGKDWRYPITSGFRLPFALALAK